MQTEGRRVGGGQSDARSYPCSSECSAEVQHCDDDRVSQRQKCDPDSSAVATDAGNTFRANVLGAGILCEYGGSG